VAEGVERAKVIIPPALLKSKKLVEHGLRLFKFPKPGREETLRKAQAIFRRLKPGKPIPSRRQLKDWGFWERAYAQLLQEYVARYGAMALARAHPLAREPVRKVVESMKAEAEDYRRAVETLPIIDPEDGETPTSPKQKFSIFPPEEVHSGQAIPEKEFLERGLVI